MRLIATIVVAGMLPAVPAAAAPTAFRVERLADGVFAFVREDLPGLLVNANVLAVVGDQDVVIVDANYTPGSARAVIAALRGLTEKPVRYVVNTHRHVDHSGGNQAYLEAFPGVEIVAHPATRDELAAKGEATLAEWRAGVPGLAADLRRALAEGKSLSGSALSAAERRSYESDLRIADDFAAGAAELRVVLPTLSVEDRLVLHRADRAVEIRALGRAHTRGDLVVWLPRERIVATGDMVVSPVPLVGADQSFIGDWSRTLDELLALEPLLILPGHGAMLRDTTYVRQLRDFLTAVDRHARAAQARGETLEQARGTLDVESFRHGMAGDDPVLRFLFDVYGARPALGAAYRETAKP